MKVKRLKLLSPLLALALALSLMAAVVLSQTAFADPAEIDVYPGPGTPLQDAINAADPGDTIIVHNGTYTENVNVNKTLTIRAATGENVTVQALDPYGPVFEVSADNVTISGFTVRNAAWSLEGAIYLDSAEHCTITNNSALNNTGGIYLVNSSNNTISGNTASGNLAGIVLDDSSNNTISGNTASGNGQGIYLSESNGTTLSGNAASGNGMYGIYLDESSNNTISGNTASGNGMYGIYLDESSNNTISGNAASDNENDGIYLSASSGNSIEGNTASENTDYGIRLNYSNNNTISGNTASGNDICGIFLYDSSNNTISGNTASGNDYGIYLYQSSGNTISGNTANDNNDYGIYVRLDSSGNTISGNTASGNGDCGIWLYHCSNNIFLNNTVHDNGHGVYIEGSSGNWFVGNDIRRNTGEEDSGVHLSGDVAGNQFLFNNIVGNSPQGSDSYGVYNENTTEIVDATPNWWGAASGPSGVGPGTGDVVSDNVTFEPWLGASVVVEDITGAQTGVVISGPTGSDTTLTVNTSADVTVIVALYAGNPEEPLPDKALGKYIDIYASDPDAIDWPVHVEMSYTEDEVAAAGIDESTLGLYYWDASANEFQRCSDTGVDTDTNIIWANVAEAEAGGLAGTPFAPGGSAAPGGLSVAVIAGIAVGACAAAGPIAYFIIRGRRAADQAT